MTSIYRQRSIPLYHHTRTAAKSFARSLLILHLSDTPHHGGSFIGEGAARNGAIFVIIFIIRPASEALVLARLVVQFTAPTVLYIADALDALCH